MELERTDFVVLALVVVRGQMDSRVVSGIDLLGVVVISHLDLGFGCLKVVSQAPVRTCLEVGLPKAARCKARVREQLEVA